MKTNPGHLSMKNHLAIILSFSLSLSSACAARNSVPADPTGSEGASFQTSAAQDAAASSEQNEASENPGSQEAELEGWKQRKSLAKKMKNLQRKSDLQVGPFDVLEVEVKNHPELAAIAKVDAWGFAQFPFIGEIRVQDLTVTQVADRLSEIYQGFVDNPQVQVQISEFNSRVFYVFGEVKRPGRYPMGERRVTIRDAIVQAELPGDRAAAWRAFVIRQTDKGPVYRHINVNRILYRGHLENDIVLKSGDVVLIPMGLLDRVVVYIGRLVGPLVGVASGLFVGGSNNNDDD